MEPDSHTITRVPLDLTLADKAEAKAASELLGLKTLSRYLRRASKFYAMLARLHHNGYLIQAVKKGSLIQFYNLDLPNPPPEIR